MNATTALKTSATYGGPAIFGAGLAMLAAALVTSGTPHTGAAGPSPGPTEASTPPIVVPATRPPSTSSTPQPSPTPTSPLPGAVFAVETSSFISQAAGGGASSARPSPSPAPPTNSCSGALAVQLPLGVLPRCTLTVGGHQ